MEKKAAMIKHIFVEAWRLYTGLDYFDDLPRISGKYYIRKPRIFEKRNTRTKRIGYIEIIAELPHTKPSFSPEYIVFVLYRSWDKRLKPYAYLRMIKYVKKRIDNIKSSIYGSFHFFIYIIANKYTVGVLEKNKKIFAKLPDNYVIRIMDENSDFTKDLRNYLQKRLEKILDPKKYVNSKYEIFGRLKRLAEYMLILLALLANDRATALSVAQLLHNSARIQVSELISVLYSIKKKGETRTTPIRQEARSPSIYT